MVLIIIRILLRVFIYLLSDNDPYYNMESD